MAESKEAVVSTENINEVGSRVITAGIDITQYQRNPVLLFMHQRFGDRMPIGRMENLRFDGGRLLGTPVFDMNDEFAKRVADKWHNGFLRMVSPHFEVLETSSAPELILAGQLRNTVTRSKLIEISIVDIGGNDDALQLSYKGKALELASGTPCDALPLLDTNAPATGDTNKNQSNTSEMKHIFLALGLGEGATSAEAVAAIETLKGKAASAETLSLAAITGAVDAAIESRKITADQKDHFVSLGKAAGLESLTKTLALMRGAAKPTDIVGRGEGSDQAGKPTVELAWGELTPESAALMKRDEPQKYIALYKAQYGALPTLEA